MGEAKFEQKPLAKAVGNALSEQAREVEAANRVCRAKSGNDLAEKKNRLAQLR